MTHKADAEIGHSLAAPAFTLSEDGYVRLTLETFRAIPLVHLLSDLDGEDCAPYREGATFAAISGYTEWFSATRPSITLGWDWQLTASQRQPCCVRTGEPRSNVMFVDVKGRDLGPVQTARLLETAIDGVCWQEAITDAITRRYA